MSNPYIGEIRMFGGSFAPAGWAFCDGSLVPISENDALFNLIGTTYGGDGQETFALPDLRGRAPVHQGTGPGLATYIIGEQSGVENVTITPNQIPTHTHRAMGAAGNTDVNPSGRLPSNLLQMYVPFELGLEGSMAGGTDAVGGSQPHENMQPYVVISFIISLFGIFPSQS